MHGATQHHGLFSQQNQSLLHSLAMAKSLGWKCFLQLSVQEHVAPRTQVAGGDITLCMCPDCFKFLLYAVVR